MAKIRLTLDPSPTFRAVVQIPMAGAKPAPVEFIFKYRDRDAFQEFVEGLGAREGDLEGVIMDIASGWDLPDAFDQANVAKLLKNYMGAFQAIMDAYVHEHTKSVPRLGN